jgi:predicted hydrocarbon binding protein
MGGKGGNDQKWERGSVQLSRHFARSTSRLRENALSRKDYDPARLYKWGQMMALAVVRMMEGTEKAFGAKGQVILNTVLVDLGREIGREVLKDYTLAPGAKEIEAISKFVTYVNEEIWASPEIPKILSDSECLCDILWCPHQDHYRPFDCRVQWYIVRGLLEAFQEKTGIVVDARFTQIIPKGAETCRFEVRILPKGEEREWTRYSSDLAQKALRGVSNDSSRKER